MYGINQGEVKSSKIYFKPGHKAAYTASNAKVVELLKHFSEEMNSCISDKAVQASIMVTVDRIDNAAVVA